MSLESKFTELSSVWESYYKAHSHFSVFSQYGDCSAFRELVALGDSVFPFVLKNYDSGLKSLWHFLVGEIAGSEFSAPVKNVAGDWVSYNLDDVVRYTREWLEHRVASSGKPATDNL